MKIKTGHEIYFEMVDVIEANKKSNYDDKTTKKRSDFDKKEFIAVDDMIKCIDDTYKELDMGKTIPIFIQRLKEKLKKKVKQ